MSAKHTLVGSAAASRAIVLCPACPEDSDGEAEATVGGGEDERGSYPYLEAYRCENGHHLGDLTPEMEGRVLESTLEWIAEALDAMRSAHDDQVYHNWRDEMR